MKNLLLVLCFFYCIRKKVDTEVSNSQNIKKEAAGINKNDLDYEYWGPDEYDYIYKVKIKFKKKIYAIIFHNRIPYYKHNKEYKFIKQIELINRHDKNTKLANIVLEKTLEYDFKYKNINDHGIEEKDKHFLIQFSLCKGANIKEINLKKALPDDDLNMCEYIYPSFKFVSILLANGGLIKQPFEDYLIHMGKRIISIFKHYSLSYFKELESTKELKLLKESKDYEDNAFDENYFELNKKYEKEIWFVINSFIKRYLEDLTVALLKEKQKQTLDLGYLKLLKKYKVSFKDPKIMKEIEKRTYGSTSKNM